MPKRQVQKFFYDAILFVQGVQLLLTYSFDKES